ncbi:putative Zn-binding protein involved in type VI secretion [Chryseobacterium ginsenosidimutans]|nr:putative Zn-binding protein involved in type VI secretion [Chryseobacterium ginsenosidimutans]
MGDKAVCTGPPDTIASGSSSVMIGGKPAARMGDSTAHGGVIAAGEATVLIGG